MTLSSLLTLHLLATVIWVGGMFFAHMALRPALVEHLAPHQRLPLFAAVFRRFFAWVWGAAAVLLVSGVLMIRLMGGGGALHWSSHAMAGIGALMMLLFALLYFFPFAAMKRALAHDDLKEAGRRLALIRAIVVTNLTLGLAAIVVAVAF